MLANFFYKLAIYFGYDPVKVIPSDINKVLIGTKVLEEYNKQKTDPETDIGITVYFLADREDPSSIKYEIY